MGIVMFVLREKPENKPTIPPISECEISESQESPEESEESAPSIEEETPSKRRKAKKQVAHREPEKYRSAFNIKKTDFKKNEPKATAPQTKSEEKVVAMKPPVAMETKEEQKIETPSVPSGQERTITINPEITSKKLSYKYGFISYSPTDLSLTINGKEIIVNNTDPITIKVDGNSIITTCCEYKFIAGYEGKKTAKWKVKPETTELTASFSWKTPEKILLEGAELISVEE